MRLDAAIAYVGGDQDPTPGMLANIIFRFIINLAAAVACWVPASLFHKNGELAGTAMVIATAILNFYYAVNAVIWHDNDFGSWSQGHVWCDVQLLSFIPLETLNAAAICAVMQNISNQVSLMRSSGFTSKEKTRKNVLQALIIFPIPALQAILYYFTIARRYNISGIIGCQAVFTGNWVFLTFFLLPCPIFAVAAAYFAVLTWWRYREIDSVSRRALYCSGNYGSRARSARTKRKLYFMALTIVVPYCPMQLVFMFNNIKLGFPWSIPYDFAQLHAPGWDEIDYAPSTVVSFVSMYINYIVALEVVVFFIYFGRTKEAHEMYRRYLRALGLGRVFPQLNGEWHPPDQPSMSAKRLWPRGQSTSSFATSTHSRSSSTSKDSTRFTKPPLNDKDDTQLLNIRLSSLDLEAARSVTDIARSRTDDPGMPYRSPWVFRTDLAPHFEFPEMPKTALFSNMNKTVSNLITETFPRPSVHPLHSSRPRPTALHGISDDQEEARARQPDCDPVALPGTWARDASASTLVGCSGVRLSDYEKGLVSIKKDFSSSNQART